MASFEAYGEALHRNGYTGDGERMCDCGEEARFTAMILAMGMLTVGQAANDYPSFHLCIQPRRTEVRRIVGQYLREILDNPESHKELFVLVVTNKPVLGGPQGGDNCCDIGRLYLRQQGEIERLFFRAGHCT